MMTKDEAIQSISEGNLNPRILAKFFTDLKIKSYSYDYNIQKELVNYKEISVDVSSGHSTLEPNVFGSGYTRIITFTLTNQFVIAGEREKYKRSSIFHKWIDIKTLNEFKRYFKYTILVFADDIFLTDYRIKAYNDKVNIAFKSSEFPADAEKLTVMFLPDSIIDMAEPTVGDFSGNHLNAMIFPQYELFDRYKKFIGFWYNKNTRKVFIIDNPVFHYRGSYIEINDMLPTVLDDYILIMVGIQDKNDVINIPSDGEWYQVTDAGMPIPKDNIIILINQNGSFVPNDGTVSITEYYPNIIRINNPNRYMLKLITLFENNPHNLHIDYDNEIRPYIKRLNILEKYRDGTISDLLKEFKPISWDYNIEDFLEKNPYLEVDFNNLWDSFLYKMDTISNYLKQWCYLYLEYERRTYGFLSGWYHNCANYDLSKKLRRTTAVDFDDPDYHYAFLTPQYLFTYKHDIETGDANSYCYYIDGKYTLPTRIIIYEDLQYVYLPASKINPDSIIEVERFDGLLFSYSFSIPREGVTLSMSKFTKKTTVANSLFLVSPSGEYLNDKEIRTIVHDEDLGDVEVDFNTSVFIIKPTSTITFIPENYTEDTVMLCVNNATCQFMMRESGNDFLNGRENEINLNAKNYLGKTKQGVLHRLRIFNNEGRLIPKRSYQVFKQNNYYDNPRFNIPIPPGFDERFIISYIGYDEELIYHRDDLPTNGLIHLEGKTSRPISLAYHDIYLNGFRLTKYDIEIIAPFTFAIKTLAKFDTVDCIEIYEKQHVSDNFVKFEWDEKSDYIMDKLFSGDEDFYQAVLDSLDNITPSGRVSDIDDLRDWFYSFFREYVPYHYINGDYRFDLEAYHHIFDKTHGRVLLNADNRIRFYNQLKALWYLSHDKSIEEYGDDYPTGPDELYEKAEETIKVDESIKIPEAQYQAEGYSEENYKRVYDLPYNYFYNPFIPTTPDDSAKIIIEHFKGDLGENMYPPLDDKGYADRYKYKYNDDNTRDDEGHSIKSINYSQINENFYKLQEVYPGIYSNLEAVPEKDLREFEALSLNDVSFMFDGCSKLKRIPNINLYNTTNATALFAGCNSLEELPNLSTFRIKDFTQFMVSCNSLPESVFENLDMDSAEETDSMFYGCKSIKHILDIDYSKISKMNSMYAYSGIEDTEATIDCSSITNEYDITAIFNGTNVEKVNLVNVDPDLIRYINPGLIGDNVKILYVNDFLYTESED